jgi:hypothetical protein
VEAQRVNGARRRLQYFLCCDATLGGNRREPPGSLPLPLPLPLPPALPLPPPLLGVACAVVPQVLGRSRLVADLVRLDSCALNLAATDSARSCSLMPPRYPIRAGAPG